MPPTFFYALCLAAYLVAMVCGLLACALLLFVPSQRRTALKVCLAIIASLPGILLFQFVVGIPIGLLLATILACYEIFQPSDPIRGLVGIPTILVIFVFVYCSFCRRLLHRRERGLADRWRDSRSCRSFAAESTAMDILKIATT